MRKTTLLGTTRLRPALAGAALAALLLPVPPALANAGAAATAAVRDDAKSPLVSTEWLEKNLDSPKVRVVEVSVDPGVYERGHVPGAHNVAWHTDLVETVSRDIAGPDKFAALVRRLGIDRDTRQQGYAVTIRDHLHHGCKARRAQIHIAAGAPA